MTSPSSLRVFSLVVLMPLCVALPALAQPSGPRDGFELTARYSHTGRSDLDAGGPATSVIVDSYQIGLRATALLSPTTGLLYGFDWANHELDLSGTGWLPGSLKSLGASLGVSHRLDDRWRLLATANPRIASAGGNLSMDGFDLPVLLFANYTTSPQLTWVFGLRYGPRSDIKVLPIAGVVWKFAPEWEFRLAWPESGLSYRATPQFTLRANAIFHGGDYRLDEDPRAPADRTGVSLNDSWIEYREVRVGIAVEYAFGRSLSLRADLGKVVSQRFEYLERGPNLQGGRPVYFTLGAVTRF